MRVTTKMLKEYRACKSQLKLFASYYPRGVTVTESKCLSVAEDFDWDWAAYVMLPRHVHKVYLKIVNDGLSGFCDRKYVFDIQRCQLKAKAFAAAVDAESRGYLLCQTPS